MKNMDFLDLWARPPLSLPFPIKFSGDERYWGFFPPWENCKIQGLFGRDGSFSKHYLQVGQSLSVESRRFPTQPLKIGRHPPPGDKVGQCSQEADAVDR